MDIFHNPKNKKQALGKDTKVERKDGVRQDTDQGHDPGGTGNEGVTSSHLVGQEKTKNSNAFGWKDLSKAFDRGNVLNTRSIRMVSKYMFQEDEPQANDNANDGIFQILEKVSEEQHQQEVAIEEDDEEDEEDDEEDLKVLKKSPKNKNGRTMTFKYQQTKWSNGVYVLTSNTTKTKKKKGTKERFNRTSKNRVINGLPHLVLESAGVGNVSDVKYMMSLAGHHPSSLVSILESFINAQGSKIRPKHRKRLDRLATGLKKLRDGGKGRNLRSKSCLRYSYLKYLMETRNDNWRRIKEVIEEFVDVVIQRVCSPHANEDPFNIRFVQENAVGRTKIMFWKINQDREMEERWIGGVCDFIMYSGKIDLFEHVSGEEMKYLISYYLPTDMKKRKGQTWFLDSDFGDRMILELEKRRSNCEKYLEGASSC